MNRTEEQKHLKGLKNYFKNKFSVGLHLFLDSLLK